MGYYSKTPKGTTLELQVRPRAGRNRIAGLQSDRLKVELKAPDEGGKANEALLRFLAKPLRVSMDSVTILTGKTSRKKTVLVRADIDERHLDDLAEQGSGRKKSGARTTGGTDHDSKR